MRYYCVKSMGNKNTNTTIAQVRTFAGDLDATRKKTNTSPVAKNSAPISNPIAEVITNKEPHTTDTVIKNYVSTPEQTLPLHTQIPDEVHNKVVSLSTPQITKEIENKTGTLKTNATVPTIKKIVSGPLTMAAANKEGNPAVIITDTKRVKYSLTQAIIESFSEWLLDLKKKSDDRKKPKYTIPDADMRKGVIQKATAKTGRTNTSDHSSVVSRIKSLKDGVPVVTDPNTKLDFSITGVPDGFIKDTRIKSPRLEMRNSAFAKKKIAGPEVEIAWETAVADKIDSLSKNNTHELFKSLKNSSIAAKEAVLLEKPISNSQELNTSSNIPDFSLTESVIVPTQILPDVTTMNHLQETPILKPGENLITEEINSQLTVKNFPKIEPVIPSIKKTILTDVNTIVSEIAEPIIPIVKSFPKITPVIPSAVAKIIIPTPEPVVVEKNTLTNNWDTINNDIKNISNSFDKEINSNNNPGLSLLKKVTHNRTLMIIVSVLPVILIGSTITYWIVSSNTVEQDIITYSSTDSQVTTPTTQSLNSSYIFNKNTILKTIEDVSSGNNSFVIINIIDENNGQVISDSRLLTLLKANVLTDFKQSITEAKIGGYRGEPWIAFSVSDMSTSFGGMLDWEKNISNDLNPWFGPTITNKQNSVLSNFSDQIIEKNDVRVLKNSNGEEKIVYGFVNQHKLLITTNTTAFLNISHNISN